MVSSTSSTMPKINHIGIKIDGSDIAESFYNRLLSADVDSSIGMPDMAVVRFSDDKDLTIATGTTFAPGKTLKISLPNAEGTSLVDVFDGEIVGIEANFSEDLNAVLIVRAYDKMHRLNRATKFKAFKDVTHSDIVSQVAQGAGLSVEQDTTSTVYKHIYQDNITDLAFLTDLARLNGYAVFMKGGKLQFKKAASLGTTTVNAEWGVNMLSFRPRLSLARQVNQADVKSWDVQQKAAIGGTKSSSSTHPTPGIMGSSGGAQANSKFSAAIRTEVRMQAISATDADNVAQAILDEINNSSMEAEGVLRGNSALKAGVKLVISGVGSQFNGDYKLTSVTHVYQPDNYTTEFRVEGMKAKTMSEILAGDSPVEDGRGQIWSGVYPAIVTSNKDEQDNTYTYGCVKVKYPWLAEDQESFWARIASPMAGSGRGWYILPEVNDEVLVAFENGNFNRPYVIGSLWNGTEAPPETIATTSVDGKIELRTFKTRAGHIFRFTDKEGEEKIELLTKSNKIELILDMKSGSEKATLHSAKDIAVTADADGKIDVTGNTGAITVKNTSGAIDVKSDSGAITVQSSSGDVTLKGMNINIEATTALNMKGATAKMEASGTVDVKGNGPVTVQSSAITAVKGSLVQIN